MKEKLIGSLDGLEEGGKGLRFDVVSVDSNTEPQALVSDSDVIPAFLVRYDYQVFAYLNRCGHIAVQLDYMPGEFFSDDGQTLICATHGAEYAPDTGKCLGGPCYGVGLEPLKIKQLDGYVYLDDEAYALAG